MSRWVFICIFFISCGGKKASVSEKIRTEVIEYKLYHHNPAGDETSLIFSPSIEKIWYRDSMAIETVSSGHTFIDKNGIREENSILWYRFNDLRSASVFEFKTFTDTARLIRKYSYLDTSIQIISGWNFPYKRKWVYRGDPESMADTVIDNISFKRFRLHTGSVKMPAIMICYFRCDKKGTIFTHDPYLSQLADGCPLTHLYYYPVLKKGLHITADVRFVSDSFTAIEEKVFDAWAKYAKENPVGSHR